MKIKFRKINKTNKLINNWNYTVWCEQSASSPSSVHCTLWLRYLLTFVKVYCNPWQNRRHRPRWCQQWVVLRWGFWLTKF